MAKETPRQGDPIIEHVKGPLGETKFIASRPFQRFLESLLATDSDIPVNISQTVYSISASVGKLFGLTNRLQKRLSNVEQVSSNNDRGVLNKEIRDRKNLEQFIHGN